MTANQAPSRWYRAHVINRRPRTVGTVTLAADQARQVWNWTLSRQGLHPDRRLTSAAEISHAALGCTPRACHHRSRPCSHAPRTLTPRSRCWTNTPG
ncbi:hypothetical protein [Pseudofrankia sp. DC12]|uniref:hypothetical protein n=1 Tax=Pseudofrankia sp. DC12 TaxID=683315 RepID=UPI0005F88E2C|nr:hypothetical protein [Pseudofrankia sp. DC12]